uniref:Myb/SANT-like DNA-binding domain-containing protein n=1 Tax=Oreochromis niloticus TaxID=8128 RepID=A0A669EYN7_ORENI
MFIGTKEQTADFIKIRGENDHLFTGVKNSATVGWRTILEKMGLQGKVTPLQAKKKWDNLKKRYKDCKYPGSGEGVSGKPNAVTWPWFGLMDEVIGQRPSIRPAVLISSLPEDTPGPSTAVGDQNEREEETDEEGGQPPTTGRKRRGDQRGHAVKAS